MNAALGCFAARANVAAPVFGLSDGVDASSPLVRSGILRLAGRRIRYDCPCGVCDRPEIEYAFGEARYWCNAEMGYIRLPEEEISFWTPDFDRVAHLLAAAVDCAGGVAAIVPRRLYSLGSTRGSFGRAHRRVLFAPRLGADDADLLPHLPGADERNYILVVGNDSLVPLPDSVRDRTFLLADIVENITEDGFVLDLDAVDDRFGSLEPRAHPARRPDREAHVHAIKLALVGYIGEIRKAYHDGRADDVRQLIRACTVPTIAELAGVARATAYRIVGDNVPSDRREDMELTWLWLRCTDFAAFRAYPDQDDLAGITRDVIRSFARRRPPVRAPIRRRRSRALFMG